MRTRDRRIIVIVEIIPGIVIGRRHDPGMRRVGVLRRSLPDRQGDHQCGNKTGYAYKHAHTLENHGYQGRFLV